MKTLLVASDHSISTLNLHYLQPGFVLLRGLGYLDENRIQINPNATYRLSTESIIEPKIEGNFIIMKGGALAQ